MAAAAAGLRQLLAVLALLSALLSAQAAEKPRQIEVDAYALVQVPGCNVGKPNSLVLPPGAFTAAAAADTDTLTASPLLPYANKVTWAIYDVKPM